MTTPQALREAAERFKKYETDPFAYVKITKTPAEEDYLRNNDRIKLANHAATILAGREEAAKHAEAVEVAIDLLFELGISRKQEVAKAILNLGPAAAFLRGLEAGE
jgi:hypothetical protein